MATTMLRTLSDTGEMVAHPDEDVRGRKVLDSSGEEIVSTPVRFDPAIANLA